MSQLPPESATATNLRVARNADLTPEDHAKNEADHDVETEQWSRLEQLIAAVRDELNFYRFAYERVNSKNKPKWKPERLPRPGVAPDKKKKQKLSDSAADFLWHHLQQSVDT